MTDEFTQRFVRPKKGRTLVVGSHVYPGRIDRRTLFEDVEGWDLIEGEGVDRVIDLEDENSLPRGEFSHIDCVSVLEHTPRPWLVAKNLQRILAVDGTIFVAVPFIWRVHNYPSDYWRFTIGAIRFLFERIEWQALRYMNLRMTEEGQKIKAYKLEGHPYFPRTEVYGFGVRV